MSWIEWMKQVVDTRERKKEKIVKDITSYSVMVGLGWWGCMTVYG